MVLGLIYNVQILGGTDPGSRKRVSGATKVGSKYQRDAKEKTEMVIVSRSQGS
jgi:hypothetical protein